MTRYMLLAFVAVLASVSLAQAQPAPEAPAGERYGFNPFLRKIVWWKGGSTGGCTNCGSSSGGPAFPPAPGAYGTPPGLGAAAPGLGYPGTPGYSMPGTLVFPHHYYMRSPRDFFMWEPNR
jgi:hypothetical protein